MRSSVPCTRARVRQRQQRGVTTLELAVVMLVFLTLTIGVVDFAMGVRAYFSLAYAAREGTRYASVRSSESIDPATLDKIANRVRSQLVLVHDENVQVQATWTPGNARGGTVRVVLTYPYESMTKLLPFKTITLTTSSESVITE